MIGKEEQTKQSVRCTSAGKIEYYEVGDLPCIRNKLDINSREKLIIHFVITNKNSEDPYKYGYQELLRYKDGKVVEKIKLRKDGDAYWTMVPFVRVRKQKYFEDLDGDGSLEFAVFPFHPGSAIWMRARIFSLKKTIEFWGEGKYQYEGNSFVQLNCMDCSKFNPKACQKCQ
ncbi:MAG: hypothetical protein ACPGJV_03015 [Bacteriovoracaceae bacterium]